MNSVKPPTATTDTPEPRHLVVFSHPALDARLARRALHRTPMPHFQSPGAAARP